MTDNPNEIREGNAYQNSLIYVTLVMFAMLQIAVISVAWGCYLPYSGFGFVIPSDLHRAAWTLVMLPGIVIVLCLWMANMLNRKLSQLTVISALLEGVFLVLIPRIYTNGSYNEVSYFTSSFMFYSALAVSTSTVFELWGGRRAGRKLLPVILGALPVAASVYIAYALIRLVVLNEIFPRVVICYIVPVITLIYFVLSLITAFSSLFSKGTLAAMWSTAAVGICIASFETVNYRPVRLLFVVGVIVVLFLQAGDIIKFVKYKEKRNDS